VATQLIMDRFPQLKRHVPEMFNAPGRLLYIGANERRHHYCPELFAAGNELTVLEAWEQNIAGLKRKEMFHNVVLGDARCVDTIQLGRRMFDYVVFWHGPEHLAVDELEGTVTKIERVTQKIVVLASPWGLYPQDAVGGNEFEIHQASLYPDDYKNLGYNVKTLGSPNVVDSHILAWKRLSFSARRRKITSPIL